jgi:hypothetical protein
MANAEELILNNGDRVQGSLVRLESGTLQWQSENFGLLSIGTEKVKTFDSALLVKISGHDGPCAIWFNEGKQLRYSCADSSDKDLQVSTVAVIEPYQQFIQRGVEVGGRVGFAGVMSRGNKEEDDWDLDVALQAKHDDYRHNVEAHYDNTNKLSQASNTEDYKLGYQLDWFFQEQWFLYGDVNTAVEESKNIDSRQSVGLGFGYQVFQRQRASLSLESGLSYIDERQSGAVIPEHSGERLNWQWRLDLKYELPFSTALFHKHTLNYSLQQGDDWELVTETGLHFPLGVGLSSDLKLKYGYDNLPAFGAQRKDSTLVVGLGYQW